MMKYWLFYTLSNLWTHFILLFSKKLTHATNRPYKKILEVAPFKLNYKPEFEYERKNCVQKGVGDDNFEWEYFKNGYFENGPPVFQNNLTYGNLILPSHPNLTCQPNLPNLT
jgi:hypothetical protein